MTRVFRQAILVPVILVAATACVAGGRAGQVGEAASQAQASPAEDPHAGHGEVPAEDAHAGHDAAQMQPLPATAGPGYTVADVRFMQDMIGHHAQALEMAAMAPTHGASDHVLRLVEKIDISQRDEIAMMKAWLTDRGQAVPDEHAMHTMPGMPGMSMPGMLTPEQMAQLDAARGVAFERLFLTFMIQHHEGALVMVDELFASPGAGQDSDIFRFATDVAADQLDEIDQMYNVLSTLANPGSEIR